MDGDQLQPTKAADGALDATSAKSHGCPAWAAKDPVGTVSKVVLPGPNQQFIFDAWQERNNLSIGRYKTDPEGVRYDIVNDGSEMGDSICRELKRVIDLVSLMIAVGA
jgi:hypothetical protein